MKKLLELLCLDQFLQQFLFDLGRQRLGIDELFADLIAGQRGGSIVFTSSTAGLKGFGGLQGGGLGYAASKHGIVGLMRTLANALAPQNIRVNTVHPTAVRTMMAVNPAMVSFLENYPDGGPHLQNPLPVDMLEPEDVSAAIAYLVGEDAKYVTGVTFPVDAGFCNKL